MAFRTVDFVGSAWKELRSSRPIMLISPKFTDLVGSYLHHNDRNSFELIALSLNNVLAPCTHEAAWLLRGEYAHRNGNLTESTWISFHTAKSRDNITGRVLDSLDPTPNLSDFMLFPATGAWEVFRKLFGDEIFFRDALRSFTPTAGS